MSELTEIFGEVISSYSREDAILDGFLCDLTQFEVTRQHYKYPVACTTAVWDLIDKADKNKRSYSSIDGILHDMFHMSKVYYREIDETSRYFQMKIVGCGRQKNYTFKMVCGPGDNGEPVLTIMLPNED